MTTSNDTAPAWLFSFVDLAFLMIIAMTQVGGDRTGMGIELGEVIVPRIQAGATTDLPKQAPERWQLRVHPAEAHAPSDVDRQPYELTLPSATADRDAYSVRLSAAELREQLRALYSTDTKKPILAPHADSRSQDMLDAVGMLEEFWPSRRRATVAPVFARQ